MCLQMWPECVDQCQCDCYTTCMTLVSTDSEWTIVNSDLTAMFRTIFRDERELVTNYEVLFM